MDGQNRVEWVYSARTNEELEQRYDEWAKDYDREFDEDFGYVGPKPAVDRLVRFVPNDGRILDAGAGTGQAGELLLRLGYRDLVGIDMSRGMLQEAGRKQVYRKLHRMVLGGPLDFPDDCFDGVISTGVMTIGHTPASALGELVRVTKPGGYLVFTVRPDYCRDGGFYEKFEELRRAGDWKQIEVSEPMQTLPKGQPDATWQVWVFQVL